MIAYLFTVKDVLTGQFMPLFEVRADSRLTAIEIVSRDIRNTFDSIPNVADMEMHLVGHYDPAFGEIVSSVKHDIFVLDRETGLAYDME